VLLSCVAPAFVNVDPSKVKFASPFNEVEPVAVKIRLFELLSTVAPAAAQVNVPDPSVVNWYPEVPSANGNTYDTLAVALPAFNPV